jgi:hypothetical protein
MESLGSVTVAAYSRHEDLEKCLKAIILARGDKPIPLIVVHQTGYDKVAKVIQENRKSIDVLLTTKAQGNTPLENINMNGLIAREIAFKWMLSDWSLGIEEDTIVAPDAINFVIECYKKHQGNRYFRGVNLGSKQPYQKNLENVYSLVSYGIQGQASMITKQTWSHFNVKKLRSKLHESGLDSLMEHYVKSGFMCTPHNSRYIDNGWNGTHGSADPEDEHYVKLRKSLTQVGIENRGPYLEQSYTIDWRKDALQFSPYKSQLRYLVCKYHHLRYLLRESLN